MYWSQRVFDHWRKHYEIRDKKYHNRLFGTASKLLGGKSSVDSKMNGERLIV